MSGHTAAAPPAIGAIATPLGLFHALCSERGIEALLFPGEPPPCVIGDPPPAARSVLERAQVQLAAYFAGELAVFDLPLAPHGTPFQRLVWEAVRAVPYGETRTYGQIAALLGLPNATRTVGHANGANPLPIIIPCHRLVGADGALRGYAGGLAMKRQLLEHERQHATRFRLAAR